MNHLAFFVLAMVNGDRKKTDQTFLLEIHFTINKWAKALALPLLAFDEHPLAEDTSESRKLKGVVEEVARLRVEECYVTCFKFKT